MRGPPIFACLPIVILPAGAVLFTPDAWPRWAFMWILAFAIYASCKWLTWWTAPPCGAAWIRQLGYLLAWPGLDAAAFLRKSAVPRPGFGAWLFALAKFSFGVAILTLGVPCVPMDREFLRGWVALVGIAFVLHFGLFHLLSLGWQALGVNARPLMDWPIRATASSDFWGRRWNTAFHDLTHRFLFRPLTGRLGATGALALGFLFSGVVHDLVISLPARGGYGGPTIFFVLQAGAIFFERSALGRRLGLGRGARGWAFTMFAYGAYGLPRLHRQLFWIYGGYVVLGIIANGLVALICPAELAGGTRLARFVCGYIAVFWGIRLSLQAVLDVKENLTTWWLHAGYHTLTVLFAIFTALFAYAALH